MAQGLPPLEKLDDEKMLVWPDLVYTELICMVALTALLARSGRIALQAPLEQPASSVKTPNPSKAPWYFLGLQEMLVYFDPWMAGVVLPSMIIVGLMAIPYIDFNKKGNGYYTIDQRQVRLHHVPVRLPGALGDADRAGHVPARPELELLRPVRDWDPHKVDPLNNVNLSDYLLGRSGAGRAGRCAGGASSDLTKTRLRNFIKEVPGILPHRLLSRWCRPCSWC